ncbi:MULTISPECIES: oxalate/formate MFS antiporter [Bradyrhizobium]|uniref:MFS transporter, OFA family, oxalate/formate antiporter n=3 Tax=Bradyrhizobium TaxID=374 RepID=A0A1H5IZR2_9BRAD|nr:MULTISPECIES: oxalate/formate MFS antiporter [Bradyrhizobium]MCC8952969.1 oxalate/formate MFS antiporter [Bradyrhizobium altum]UGY01910.1 oxalate/formate MFS antiporter [Bradyrhizobium quebecense]SEE45773.1 MFS transporter, OFA family, oxalate/formate antiporter [Bradyrhizobium erythrophlei]
MSDMVQATAAPAAARVSDTYRWTQLAIGVAAMVMIANYQYGWTFFVPDIQKKFGWDRASIQWAFTLFVLFETWLVPVEGWFVDKYGPRLVVLIGGILCAIGWAINAQATSLNGYYLGMIIAGIGAGGVYGTCVGNALKWFPDKRGLAAGITAAGFGAGSALTVAPIQAMIKDSGFQTTFLYFGLGQGIIIVLLAFFLLAPKAGQVPAVVANANIIQTRRNYQPTEVLRQPIFWLMYFMFVIVGAGGLMVTANLKPIAVDWKVDSVPVTLMAVTMTAVTFAATIDRVLNGLTRPFFGWISDMIGRENTMFIAFGMEGFGIWMLYLWGHDPVWFVLLSGFVFFAWGEIYSLFPSTCTDTFGAKFATTNAGLLYTAKGTAALLVPIANYMQQSSGHWDNVFIIAAGANILASLLAIAVLKPWRKIVVAKSAAMA